MSQNKIKFFDSNCHPNVNGYWLKKKINNDFNNLKNSIDKNDLMGCLAVGLENIDNYDIYSFINECQKYSNIIPIAGINPISNGFKNEIQEISNLGYRGIKIHPRFSNIDLKESQKLLFDNIKFCNEHNLLVLFCTYFNNKEGGYIIENPKNYMNDLLEHCYETKIILMHTGYMLFNDFLTTLLKFNNVLFDFSYTIMNIKTSKNRKELKDIINNNFNRICIGSDWPEYSHKSVIDQLKTLFEDIDSQKINKMTYQNILEFIG